MTSRPMPRKPVVGPGGEFTPPPETPFDPGDGLFPVFPPRGDMQNPIYLHRPGHLAALSLHFGAPDTTIVLGEVPVGRDISQRQGLRTPDLLIAFGVDPDKIIADRGYSIAEWGKPPDFVMEIASRSTARNDIGDKRNDYAAFGIPEYWRFDPSGGRYYGTHLAGDRLVGEVYQPISIVRVDGTHYWGHSPALGLDICWENERLRWYDPMAQRYLLTFDETDEERIDAQMERDAARYERDSALIERETERRARLAAEERVKELEAEIRRLQD